MYKKYNHANLLLSTVGTSIPTVAELQGAGSAINAEDLKLFYLDQGQVVVRDISPSAAMQLAGIRKVLTGRIDIGPIVGVKGTNVQLQGIGNIIRVGDEFRLPYGKKATALFLPDNDNVFITEEYSPIEFSNGQIVKSVNSSTTTGIELVWELLKAKEVTYKPPAPPVSPVTPPIVPPVITLGNSGVMTGFRVTSDAGVGVTALTVNGSVYDDSIKDNIDFTDFTIEPTVGDKYLLLKEGTVTPVTTDGVPEADDIILCTFGRVYNPYESSRHGTVEGIPVNWATKDLSKASFLWHPLAIDNPEAVEAYNKFHNDQMPYYPVNSPLYGCQVAKGDLTKYTDSELRLADGDDISNVYYDGGNLKLNDVLTDAKISNSIFEGNGKLLYYMLISTRGDSWTAGSNVIIENVTFSQFDELPDVWNSNSDAIKPASGVTFKNVKTFNTPNDPYKIEKDVVYDGFTAYRIGMKTASHCDGFQASGSPHRIQENCVIKNGTIWMPSRESLNPTQDQEGEVNGAIYLDPDFGPEDSVDKVSIRNIVVEDCFFNGGIHTLWVLNFSGQGFRVADVHFRNLMLGLDWSRAFAIEHSSPDNDPEFGAIVEWSNVRRIDNGELIAQPTQTNYKVTS